MKPIVTITMSHTCPMVTGVTPHVGGPIIGPGASNVLVNGKPASLVGDSCICCGPPDVIVQGAPSVLINGTPVVTQGSMTAHGGTIPMGDPTVLIGSASPVTMKHKSPQRNKFLAAMSGNSLKEAISNQDKLQEEVTQQEPMVYNVRWIREDVRIGTSKECEKVKVVASVIGIADGESVDFEITRVLESDQSPKVYHLSGIVKDGEVETEIEIEKLEEKESSEEKTDNN